VSGVCQQHVFQDVVWWVFEFAAQQHVEVGKIKGLDSQIFLLVPLTPVLFTIIIVYKLERQ